MNRKGQIGRLTAMYVFIFLAVIMGLIGQYLIGSFVDISQPDSSSAVAGVVSFFTDGIELSLFIWDLHFDIFSFLPDTMENYLDNTFNSFTYLPDFISLPLFLIMASSLFYFVITLIPTIGG